MAVYRIDNDTPRIAPTAWVADSAQVMGRVELHDNANIWFGAVLRGDTEQMTIGRASNVQDGSIVHSDFGFPTVLGERVTVGHQVMLHGCTIGDGSLIGIQAVVMNGAVIGKQCLVGAGAIVTERKTFPDRMLIIGAPAKAMRELTDAEVANLASAAAGYVSRGGLFRDELERVG